ncbi:MAG: hexose kinase [Acidimicrobiales bacterium]|nr:hexose kinase [Acidimicrobiales bacterium]
MITTITPNPSLDRTIVVDTLAIGEVHSTAGTTIEAGGKGVNVARGLIRQGIEAQAAVLCGSSGNTLFFGSLEDAGVPVLVADSGTPVRTNLSIIERGGRTTKLNEPGAMVTTESVDHLYAQAEAAAAGSSWVVAAGSLAPGVPTDFYQALAERIGRTAALFAVDASGPALAATLEVPGVLLKPNDEELAAVWPTPLDSDGDLIGAARSIVERTGGTVLLSLGERGAAAVTPDGVCRGSAPTAKVQNTVGAGDSLLAGYIAGYDASEGSIEEALRTGLAWARAAVGSKGTGFDAVSAADVEAVRIQGLDR